MSAIAGIYYLDGRLVDRTDLERMVISLAHRGPNGSGIWCQGSVGFGHQMLWTTPESLQEKLPLVHQTGYFAITADARIDNRPELMAALSLKQQREISDSELILAAYEKWGERSPEKLLGDFAFVIWDKRRQVLFCARDHFGVKPFYYYRSHHIFVFATEIKALLCLPEIPRQLNETRVGDYLIPILEDKTITFYQDILRLAPGHDMVVGQKEMRWCEAPSFGRSHSYWSLDPARELKLGSNQEYAEAFRELFTEAVRCRLRSAFPVGSTLSGGLDSSSVTCVARELLAEKNQQPLHTFSAIFDKVTQCDERPFINAVLAQGNLKPDYIHTDQLSPFTNINRMLWHEDEAFVVPNLFMIWGLYGAAFEQGVRVVLDGHDGDTTVSHGFSYLSDLARTWQWHTLVKELKPLAKHFHTSPRKLLLRYGLKPLAPKPIQDIWKILRRGNQFIWKAKNHTINSDFAQRLALEERIQFLQAHQAYLAQTAREAHYRGLTNGLNPLTLEEADKVAAAFSVELRHPFFDKRLAEFCLAIPADQKLNQGWTRMVMRRAMANILPIEIQWRGGKTNLSANFLHGLQIFDRELLESVIFQKSEIIEQYVNINALREVYARFISQEMNNADALILWKSVTLALWLRHACFA
ncbi:MAG: lasso peptide isopeptide bond-forming cyclase [Aphanothece sp. CMT-3BRIN-NPC111]|nr:lasso peptide isopeptide bond-forming cyclase [Aphanothece sp. CMT-3BRIN-NPC111]